MNSITSLATIERLRLLFAAYGLPKILVNDNGPQLVSKEVEDFLSQNGIKHIKTATDKPSSTGQLENFVRSFKQSLVKTGDSGNMSHKLAKFLFSYRNTPNTVTGKSPAESFLNCKIRTKFSLVFPDPTIKITNSYTPTKMIHNSIAGKLACIQARRCRTCN
jgi:transposase InsO family protein